MTNNITAEEELIVENLDEEFKNDPELEQKIQEIQLKLQAQSLSSSQPLINNNNNNSTPNVNNNNNNNNNDKRNAKEAEYAYYKGLAMNKDLSDIAKLNIIQIVGKDQSNRPIVMALPKNIPPKGLNFELLLLYAIQILDPIVDEEYVLIYANTDATSDNRPAFAWLQKVYGIFNRKYKKNLKALLIVHPSIWIRFILKLFKPFISEKFWRKLTYVEDINQVPLILGSDVPFPNFVIRANHKSFPQPPIFGSTLEYVLRVEKNPNGIPRVMEDCIGYLSNHLEVEGIFRLSGSSVDIEQLSHCYNRRERVDLERVNDPHTVAGLLKLYLRNLPDPLFPFSAYDSFISTHNEYKDKEIDEWITQMARILNQLPPCNIKVLKVLFDFIDEILAHSDVNKMTSVNLSIVFAPNIMQTKSSNPLLAMEHSSMINTIIKRFLDHKKLLWSQIVC